MVSQTTGFVEQAACNLAQGMKQRDFVSCCNTSEECEWKAPQLTFIPAKLVDKFLNEL
jgi:hypothetical protein